MMNTTKHVFAHRPSGSIIETAKRLDAVIRLQQIAADARIPDVVRNEAKSALYNQGYSAGLTAWAINSLFGTKLQKKFVRTKSPIKKNALEIKISKKSPGKPMLKSKPMR